MKKEYLTKLLEFTTETAYLAGRTTLAYYQTGVHADIKADESPVTVADQKAEELIRGQIEKKYPGHSILGEEYGQNDSLTASHRWIIDPIDGTKSFLRGVPLYAVLIGLEIEGRIEVGAAYFPALDEMIAAASGHGCLWNGRRAYVSGIESVDQGIVSCTSTQNFGRFGKQKAWEKIIKEFYFQVGWGDAYGYALVATGRIELMLDPIMAIWDCGPFPVILREAGGFFGNWQGEETIYAQEGLATTQKLLPKVLGLIQG